MRDGLIERRSGGLHYYVDPSTSSNLLFEKKSLEALENAGCDLSVTGVSLHIRKNNEVYRPTLLTWEMTSRCNFNCPFCYIRNNEIDKEVSFQEAKDVIDQLVLEGLFEVYLSGGECLLVKDFLKIYSYLKMKGVFVTVFTNGSLINDEVIECWKKLPPSSVEITLYSDDFSSKPYESIEVLSKMGIYVLTKFTLTNTTYCYYEAVKQWVNERNLPFNVDASLYDGNDALHTGIKEKYSLSNEQKHQYLSDKKVKYDGEKVMRTALACKSRKGIVQISPDFTLSLCNKMKTRWDLRKIETVAALEELRFLIKKYEKKKLHGCKGCIYSRNCSMCIVSAEFRNGEFYVPDGYCESIREFSLGLY